MPEDKKSPPIHEQVVNLYREQVTQIHPSFTSAWPIISGYNSNLGIYKKWVILILIHTGISHVKMNGNLGEITSAITGVSDITNENKNSVRSRIERHFRVGAHDAVIFLEKTPSGGLEAYDEISIALRKHEYVMGAVPMRIFLSHKGADKPLVREFKATLELLGFSPWLDEDAMSAGAELERSILQGFIDSCAAIFFVTPKGTSQNPCRRREP